MRALNIVGFKKSGKTTLAVELGRALKDMGVQAAAVKCTHHVGFDKKGTDTDKLFQVFEQVAGVTSDEAVMFFKGKRYIPDLLPLMESEHLVIEGGKSLGWLPRVLLLKTEADAEELDKELAIATYGEITIPGIPNVSTPKELAKLLMEKSFALPGIDCGYCNRLDCRALAAEIIAGKATLHDCKATHSTTTVSINGTPLPLNEFVLNFFSGGVLGMLKECKGFAPGDIEIKITQGQK